VPGTVIGAAGRRGQRGQTLVIFAGGVAGLLALVGLVVDGANAYAQHRTTQNAADAAGQAGAAVLARAILSGEPPVDFDVKHAINAIATENGVNPFFPFTGTASSAYYTDIDGNMITSGGGPARVGAGMPACSVGCIDGHPVGVRAVAVRPFRALLAGIVGQTNFTARSEATAVTGYLTEPCDADEACPLLPVTVSMNQGACLPNGEPAYDPVPWLRADADYSSSTEVVLPLCDEPPDTVEGTADWLDYECSSTLKGQVKTPCNDMVDFPSWIRAWNGGTSGVDAAFDAYHGRAIGTFERGSDSVVLIPIFEGVCHEDPGSREPRGSAFPKTCNGFDPTADPVRFYYTPHFTAFVVDAYLEGSAASSCTGGAVQITTTTTTGGVEGCLKGWFADAVLPPGPVGTEAFENGEPKPLTIQLIR